MLRNHILTKDIIIFTDLVPSILLYNNINIQQSKDIPNIIYNYMYIFNKLWTFIGIFKNIHRCKTDSYYFYKYIC